MAARKCYNHRARPSYCSQEMPQSQSIDQAMMARKYYNYRARPSYGSQEMPQSQVTDQVMEARKVPQSQTKLWQPGTCHKGHRPSYGSQENAPIKGHYGRQEIPQSQLAVAARKCYDHRVQAKLWQP